MCLNVYQNITINHLRVEAVTNASVLQIGSAGFIRSLAQLYNTGGFTGPAPQILGPSPNIISLVRLPNPS
ncbi:spore germination protein GerPB [Cohnella caldifontis]|uniref:spore germination protein GerPB n=1 Tax=Cohnella caldifontis TaxID=3027471 RepID=UPI0023EB9CEB|nr:spore germination protein GerPB [Cohnella sp. YIM B05605]